MYICIIMDALHLFLIAMLAFGAAFVQRTTSFGFGIFIMTGLPFLLPNYGEATTLSGMLAMVTATLLAYRYHKSLVWKHLLPILITFIITGIASVYLLKQLPSHAVKRMLGVILILVAVYFWRFGGRVNVKPNLPTQIGLGSLSGFMGGMFGMQGPPAVLYFLKVSPTKEAYTAIAQTFFALGNFAMTLYRAHSGFLTENVVEAWCFGLPAIFLGTWIGGKVYKKLSLPVVTKAVYVIIAVSGVLALVS